MFDYLSGVDAGYYTSISAVDSYAYIAGATIRICSRLSWFNLKRT
jgi:hypothetical protein